MKEIVVYTAIFNNYDTLKDPISPSDKVDYVCFTDNPKLSSKIWKVKYMNIVGKNPSLMNREIKLLYPYTTLNQYKYSLYVDGSILLKDDVFKFLEKYIYKEYHIYNFKHPVCNCLYDEFIRCIRENKGNPKKLILQYSTYMNDCMPEKYGMSDNKILLRKNDDPVGQNLMEEWYRHVCNYSGRDQVCLPYILYKNGLTYCFFEEDITSNDFFEEWPHCNDSKIRWLWRYFEFYASQSLCLKPLLYILQSKFKPFMKKMIYSH